MSKKRKQWDNGWSLSPAVKAASDVPDSATIGETIAAAVDERLQIVEQLAEQVAALAEHVEAVAVRLGELEEAGAEKAGKRKATVKGEHRDLHGRRITNERRGTTRRVAKSKPPAEPAFSFTPAVARARLPGTVPTLLAAAARGAANPIPEDPDRDPWGRFRPNRRPVERDQHGRAVQR